MTKQLPKTTGGLASCVRAITARGGLDVDHDSVTLTIGSKKLTMRLAEHEGQSQWTAEITGQPGRVFFDFDRDLAKAVGFMTQPGTETSFSPAPGS